jgi:hypothetical protein
MTKIASRGNYEYNNLQLWVRILSDDIAEEDWESHVAEYFLRCPLCGSKTLGFDVEYGRSLDYIYCWGCNAKWEIDWKGEDLRIESITLVEVGNTDKNGLKGVKQSPEFWRRMVLQAKEVEAITKEKEVIREKEVIIRVRCAYCGTLYNEVLDVCPHCGGKR